MTDVYGNWGLFIIIRLSIEAVISSMRIRIWCWMCPRLLINLVWRFVSILAIIGLISDGT